MYILTEQEKSKLEKITNLCKHVAKYNDGEARFDLLKDRMKRAIQTHNRNLNILKKAGIFEEFKEHIYQWAKDGIDLRKISLAQLIKQAIVWFKETNWSDFYNAKTKKYRSALALVVVCSNLICCIAICFGLNPFFLTVTKDNYIRMLLVIGILGPIGEEVSKKLSKDYDVQKEYWFGFNGFEFCSYVINDLVISLLTGCFSFSGFSIFVLVRLACVLMHTLTTRIQSHPTTVFSDKFKLVSGIAIHVLWNVLALIWSFFGYSTLSFLGVGSSILVTMSYIFNKILNMKSSENLDTSTVPIPA